jgi:hypothetical protein
LHLTMKGKLLLAKTLFQGLVGISKFFFENPL